MNGNETSDSTNRDESLLKLYRDFDANHQYRRRPILAGGFAPDLHCEHKTTDIFIWAVTAITFYVIEPSIKLTMFLIL